MEMNRSLSVLRSTPSNPDMRSDMVRASGTPLQQLQQQQQYQPVQYQMVSPPLQVSHHAGSHSVVNPVVTSQHGLNMTRREPIEARNSLRPLERR